MLELIFNSEKGTFTEAGFILIFAVIPLLLLIFTVLLIKRLNKTTFLKLNKRVLIKVKKMSKKKEPRYQEMLERGNVLCFSCYYFSWFILLQKTESGCLLEVDEAGNLKLFPIIAKGIHSYDDPILLTYNDFEKDKCKLENDILTVKLKGDKAPYKIVKNQYTQDKVYDYFINRLGVRTQVV